MKGQVAKRSLRSAIYTRVSTDQGLEQDFNSLDAQREASEAYIKSQAHEGWRLVRDRYDDGGFSGGSMVRPALQKLLGDVQARRIDVIVVYKVDRLTRSLTDFAKLVEAAVEGRLPRGFGLKRLVDLPMAWPDQWRTLGLQTPAQA
jgi:site-specific DNA recombinase